MTRIRFAGVRFAGVRFARGSFRPRSVPLVVRFACGSEGRWRTWPTQLTRATTTGQTNLGMCVVSYLSLPSSLLIDQTNDNATNVFSQSFQFLYDKIVYKRYVFPVIPVIRGFRNYGKSVSGTNHERNGPQTKRTGGETNPCETNPGETNPCQAGL